MNVTEHACERYVERVLNIPEASSKSYARVHRKEITQRILEMFGKATWIYHDTYEREDEPADFYIAGGFVFVVCQKGNIVTMHPINLNLTKSATVRVANTLVSEIKQQHKRLETAKKNAGIKEEKLDRQLKGVNEELASLHKRMSKLDKRRYALEKQKENIADQCRQIEDEIYSNVAPLIRKNVFISGGVKQNVK